MSTILERPEAQALLGQATVSPAAVARCARDLTALLGRYLPLFYRDEQRDHAATLLRGKLTGLQRKTTEPIASRAGQKRRPLQHFVGAGRWSDPAVRAELRAHVRRSWLTRTPCWCWTTTACPRRGRAPAASPG